LADRACLQDLQTTNPLLDKSRIERENGGLLKDVYNWIFDHADFKRWRYEQQRQLLWIKGDPGKGKTMLLCGIIDELKKSGLNTFFVSFFFCQAADVRINNATAVLRGLISMLVDQKRSLISHVRRHYDKAGKQVFEDVNAWDA
jgi:Cdc6-like AAA superfamily ATPase